MTDHLDLVMNSSITCHTTAGNFTGKLINVAPNAAMVLHDEEQDVVHLVFNEELAAVSIYQPSDAVMQHVTQT